MDVQLTELGMRWRRVSVFGDQVVVAAMIDRIVHHADVISLKGASYRLKDSGHVAFRTAREHHKLELQPTTNRI
jgi:hypothetical protein